MQYVPRSEQVAELALLLDDFSDDELWSAFTLNDDDADDETIECLVRRDLQAEGLL